MKDTNNIPPVVYNAVEAIKATLAGVNKGTDRGLARVIWTMMSGAMLNSRGALIPALAGTGLEKQAVLHSWAASRRGNWEVNKLLSNWNGYCERHSLWQAKWYAKKTNGNGYDSNHAQRPKEEP